MLAIMKTILTNWIINKEDNQQEMLISFLIFVTNKRRKSSNIQNFGKTIISSFIGASIRDIKEREIVEGFLPFYYFCGNGWLTPK